MQKRAAAVLALGGIATPDGRRAGVELDQHLRPDGNKLIEKPTAGPGGADGSAAPPAKPADKADKASKKPDAKGDAKGAEEAINKLAKIDPTNQDLQQFRDKLTELKAGKK